MESILTAGPWGAIGGLIIVVIILLKSKNSVDCPVVEGGGTPMAKEQHDEVCAAKWNLNEEKLKHITETTNRIESKVDDLPTKINGGKR